MEQDLGEFRKTVYKLYLEGKYTEALETAEEASTRFRDEISETSFWIACLDCVLHKENEALQILESSLSAGTWWSPKQLEMEKDLNPLKDRQEFKEILEECCHRFEEEQKESRPERLVFCPENLDEKKKRPLFVALHMKGGNAEETSRHWMHVVKTGHVLLVPQSSQLFGPKEYCWDDWNTSKKEVLGHINEIKGSYSIDEDSIVVAGASQGASVGIIDLVLGDTSLNLRKCIAVVPSVDDLSFYTPLLEGAASRRVRAYVLSGEKDHFLENTKKLYQEMTKVGIHCKLEVVRGLGHDFPPNFDDYIDEALNYLEAK